MVKTAMLKTFNALIFVPVVNTEWEQIFFMFPKLTMSLAQTNDDAMYKNSEQITKRCCSGSTDAIMLKSTRRKLLNWLVESYEKTDKHKVKKVV